MESGFVLLPFSSWIKTVFKSPVRAPVSPPRGQETPWTVHVQGVPGTVETPGVCNVSQSEQGVANHFFYKV